MQVKRGKEFYPKDEYFGFVKNKHVSKEVVVLTRKSDKSSKDDRDSQYATKNKIVMWFLSREM